MQTANSKLIEDKIFSMQMQLEEHVANLTRGRTIQTQAYNHCHITSPTLPEVKNWDGISFTFSWSDSFSIHHVSRFFFHAELILYLKLFFSNHSYFQGMTLKSLRRGILERNHPHAPGVVIKPLPLLREMVLAPSSHYDSIYLVLDRGTISLLRPHMSNFLTLSYIQVVVVVVVLVAGIMMRWQKGSKWCMRSCCTMSTNACR
jgi:hypothetical protein